MFGSIFTSKKKIIKQLVDMVRYLIVDTNRLRQKLQKIEYRQGLRFGGNHKLNKSKKSNWGLFSPTSAKVCYLPLFFLYFFE